MKKMRKIIKAIRLLFILILVLLFCLAFCSPRPVFAADLPAYTAITQFRDYIAQPQTNAILSQFYTYSYLGLTWHYRDGSTVSYRVNLVVGSMSNSSSNGYDYVTYYPATGSYYYTSEDNYLVPHAFTGVVRVQYYNTARQVNFLGDGYWFYQPSGLAFYGLVDYCDLTDSYYSNHADGSSLVKHNLYNLPSSFNGTISTPSSGDTLGDSIDKSIDTVAPAPVVTTVPPYQPPATLPPATLPPDIITMLPPETNEDGTYLIDYSPYIYGEAFEPPVTHYDDNIIYSSAQMINYSFGFFRDSDFFNIAVLACLLAIALHILT